LKAGKVIWHKSIDTGYKNNVPRRVFDEFLINNSIVDKGLQINSFIRGVLNEMEMKKSDIFTKSHFMSIVYKALLRESILNIIKQLMVGNDFENTSLSAMLHKL